MNNILIYGGTFDPPHYGHLNTADAIQHLIHFDQVIFLPCKVPVLKKPALATDEQRLTMLKLALEDYSDFAIDTREMTRSTPSFMVETLTSFRQELGDKAAITLAIGADAFMQLPQWHRWEKILPLANLLIMRRTSVDEQQFPEVLQALLLTHETLDKESLKTHANGKIIRLNAGEYPYSSTWLREQVHLGHRIETFVPERVIEYIKSQALYL